MDVMVKHLFRHPQKNFAYPCKVFLRSQRSLYVDLHRKFLTKILSLENGAKRCKGVHCVDLGESFRTSIYLQKSASIQPRTSPSKFGGRYFQYDSIVSLGSSRRHALPLRARRPSRGRSWSGCRSANFGIWRGVDQSAVTLSRELWTRRSLRR